MLPPSLKKSFGQHHLVDGELCRPLLEYLDPRGRHVLEIGAGGGVLTEQLLAAGARVSACEVDLEWVFHLRHRLVDAAGRIPLRILALDALDLDARRLPAPTRVTGNLPFNVATRIIESLLPQAARIPRAAFMVQKEVAERLVASPGTRAYGSLSVLVTAYAEACYLGTVRPGSFRPPPKVAAAFVGLDLRAPPLPPDEMPGFVGLVRLAFAQRRKTLRNALAAGWGRELSEEVLRTAGVEARRRAETLGLDAFVELHRVHRDLVDGA